jgi:hypothetical protein
LSWSLGVLVPFAPGGLGVQEASGAALIAFIAPTAVAAATMIVLRVLMVGVEAATAGVAYAADRNRRPGALHRASRNRSRAASHNRSRAASRNRSRAASRASDDDPGELSAPAKPEEVSR